MKLIKEIDFTEAHKFIQDQIYRELYDEEEREESGEILAGQMTLNLVEFDPTHQEDKESLEHYFNQKVRDEGLPLDSDVDAIGQDNIINDPILILTGYCREGRHRLAAALKYNLKIQAYTD